MNKRLYVVIWCLAFVSCGVNQIPTQGYIKSPELGKFLSESKWYVPVTAITKGPGFHWFGYYDKFETDPSDRYVLAMKSDFENRTPTKDDAILVGMIDLNTGAEWIQLGTSRAWNWQQGCMLQWRPGRKNEVIWNDQVDGKFVCHILNVKTKKKRTIPYPIFTVSPDGKYALSHDFERVQDVRAGYGYPGVTDRNKDVLAPTDAGIYKISLDSGTSEMIISLKTVADISYPHEDLSQYKHYFNGLLYSPSGDRFLIIHRWANPKEAARVSALGTRFLSASSSGKDIHVVNDSRMTSHFCWKNDRQILAWANRPEVGNRFFLFDDLRQAGSNYHVVGEKILNEDGHCYFIPGTDWIVLDTYRNQQGQVELFLFNTNTNQKIPLALLNMDKKYEGEWRVDLHPRQSRDGKKIFVDCPIGLEGRQILMFDISGLKLK